MKLEKVTQQNAAMVEEATAASLQAQATTLMRAVGSFKLARILKLQVDG